MNRLAGVDVVKVAAIIAVIMIHTTPFKTLGSENQNYELASIIIDQVSRFAIPYFFVISGYFWGLKLKNNISIKTASSKSLKRIIIIFVAWSIIYTLPYNLSSIFEYGLIGPIKVACWNIENLLSNPLKLIFQGTKIHLWFLMSLANALVITTLFVRKGWNKALIGLALLLYIFGILAKAYADTPIGIQFYHNTRNGPFFSTIFFVTGYLLSKNRPRESWLTYGVFLLLGGCALHLSEIFLIRKYFGTSPYQDYVIGTYFMGLGIAMVALSNRPILNVNIVRQVGQYTLGIYAVHLIFVDLLKPINEYVSNPAWDLCYIVLVMLLSTCVAILASKNKVTRVIVV